MCCQSVGGVVNSSSGSMLMSSGVVCGLIAIISAICNSPALPSASITILLTANSNRLGERVSSCLVERKFYSRIFSICTNIVSLHYFIANENAVISNLATYLLPEKGRARYTTEVILFQVVAIRLFKNIGLTCPRKTRLGL